MLQAKIEMTLEKIIMISRMELLFARNVFFSFLYIAYFKQNRILKTLFTFNLQKVSFRLFFIYKSPEMLSDRKGLACIGKIEF